MTSKFSSASQVALHVLRNQGPKTTHQLYRACQALDAPAKEPYIAPHHRDYRIIGKKVHAGTVVPPRPDHLVRSVRYLKTVLKNLDAYQQVGHCTVDKWIRSTQKAGLEDLLEEAKGLKAGLKQGGDSDYIWIDGERYKRMNDVKPPARTGPPRSRKAQPPRSQANVSPIQPQASP